MILVTARKVGGEEGGGAKRRDLTRNCSCSALGDHIAGAGVKRGHTESPFDHLEHSIASDFKSFHSPNTPRVRPSLLSGNRISPLSPSSKQNKALPSYYWKLPYPSHPTFYFITPDVLRLSSPDCLAKLTVQQTQNVHSHSILSIILFPICLLFSFDPSFITAEKRLRDAGGNTTTAKMEPVLCRSPETSATKGLRSDLVWSSKSHEKSDTFVTVERKRLRVRWRGDVKPRK